MPAQKTEMDPEVVFASHQDDIAVAKPDIGVAFRKATLDIWPCGSRAFGMSVGAEVIHHDGRGILSKRPRAISVVAY